MLIFPYDYVGSGGLSFQEPLGWMLLLASYKL